FYFDIKPKKDAPCSILTSDNIKSRIDPKSFIDLSGSYHFAQLPNLSYFVGASYPYSKLADFSDTLMLLPQTPTADEIHT
ncbi:cellulose biosynthesis cyclic di-GMP-binding regulatory protein BcsB, partial [Pseudomonas syringae]|nr:cellulose biosynthesis cyclic di-GMP-binding regulatory protein BcsB [Pseudomonas syringae]